MEILPLFIEQTGGRTMKTALTIAGSDSSGGAGIQADIKTMMANGVYAMSAVTALTAQNTTGVSAIMEVEPDFLAKQLDAVFTDIRPDAVKVGMVSSKNLIEVIVDKCIRYEVENLVVDPVMVATSGAKLITEDAIDFLKKKLFPISTVITPNIPETEMLAECQILTDDDRQQAARKLNSRFSCAVLCKGGHGIQDTSDLLVSSDGVRWFYGERVDNPNTHGTGCTLSSAIASWLAQGAKLEQAVEKAKEYITGALKSGMNLGSGSGPLNHAYCFYSSDGLQ
jgi:hydroxymethylpyrimidine/phosphomethylpyrimidine kinase